MAQLKVPMDATRFATGMTWKDYMAQMGDNRAKTEENYSRCALTDDERKFFGTVQGVKYAIMTAENWCGDVVRNSPLISHVCDAIPGCELRVFFRDKNYDIADSYLNNGYRSIPVIAFFDQDWNEIGRWVERAGAATQKMYGIRSKTLDVAPADQQEAAMAEFRKQVAATYEGPNTLWRETAKEVRGVLETRLGLAPAEKK